MMPARELLKLACSGQITVFFPDFFTANSMCVSIERLPLFLHVVRRINAYVERLHV